MSPDKEIYRQIRIDLGCSHHKRDGYIGIDIIRSDNVDVIADARKLPFKDDSVGEIYSSYTLEHIDDQLAVISEIWRVCRDGAEVRLILPHYSNPAYWDDLTHRHMYSSRSLEHYDQDLHSITGYPNYLPNVNMKVVSSELRWWPPQVIARKSAWKKLILTVVNNVINYFANANKFLCERIWCRWVGGFYEVDFTIRIIK